uniref:Uncharacterized protein n=1 Tax=Oryza sativa subsp. japonica TaxID=39947 RepID=Q8GSD6_ORYSJ|nr:hypothetical protein [Oryza sativa Japonica Group]BAC21525.1 hypothetical protein [Oryza sativa Japonica Group]
MNICEFLHLNFNLKWIFCVSRGEGRADRVHGRGTHGAGRCEPGCARSTVDRGAAAGPPWTVPCRGGVVASRRVVPLRHRGVASCRDDIGVVVGNEAAGGNREGKREVEIGER